MDTSYWALTMFPALLLLLLLGYPIAPTLGAVSLGFGLLFLEPGFFDLLPLRIWGIMTNFTLLAVPLFIFMGMLLQRSGLAEELLETTSLLCAGLRGGMALAVIAVGALFAAATGIVGATVVTLGIIALPGMLRHAYAPSLAAGTITASGTLGQIIPPSIVLILLGDILGLSVGKLFMAALLPGLLLVLLFMVYVLILVRCRPAMAPMPQRLDQASRKQLKLRALRSLMPPLLLIGGVLGSIFFGLASPTEAAAVGAAGALLLAVLLGSLRLQGVRESARQTVRLSSMVFLVLIGATSFGLVFRGMGGDRIVEELLIAMPGGPWGFLLVSMLLLFVLGMFLDFLEICFIVVPLLGPIAQQLGVDTLWFAVLIAINLQSSFMTPPFGFSLFYLKAVAPPDLKLGVIYRGALPFVAIQAVVLLLVAAWPALIHWLPGLVERAS